MGQFGDELRGERERRGVSIDMICAITKVSSRHVQALEANRFGELPGGVFRKGILRNYLSTVGLEESDWMNRFEDALRASGHAGESEADWAEFAVNVKRSRVPAGGGLRLKWLGVAAMLLAVAGMSWAAWHFVVEPRLRRPAPVGTGQIRLLPDPIRTRRVGISSRLG
jgi:cytoskeletal protein RodZ